jgi:hypothetical protein
MTNHYNASMLSLSDLDALISNNHPLIGRHPYLNEMFEEIESQSSMNHASNLRILSAESYNDGQGMLRDPRHNQASKSALPFGIIHHSACRLDPEFPADTQDTKVSEAQDFGPGQKTSRTEDQTVDDARVKQKVRGRPRINSEDDTTANVGVSRFWFGHFV